MATIRAARPVASSESRSKRLSLGGFIVPLATAVALLGAAVVLVLPPALLHPLLDAAGSHIALGVSPGVAHSLSNLTVTELVFGPAAFAFAGPDGSPMYDASEIAHLRDARTLLWVFLTVAALSALIAVSIAVRSERRQALRWVARGGGTLAVAIVVLGVVALVAFGPAFDLFHRLFFAGGTWAFDATTQRLVQLYPLPFWQLVSGLVGAIAAVLGIGTWALARRTGARVAEQAG